MKTFSGAALGPPKSDVEKKDILSATVLFANCDAAWTSYICGKLVAEVGIGNEK